MRSYGVTPSDELDHPDRHEAGEGLLFRLVNGRGCYYADPLMSCLEALGVDFDLDRHPDDLSLRFERPCLICKARLFLGLPIR